MGTPSPDHDKSEVSDVIVLRAREELHKGTAHNAVSLLAAVNPKHLNEEALELLATATQAAHLERELASYVHDAKKDKTVTRGEASLILTIAEQYLLLNPANANVQKLVSQCRNVIDKDPADDATTNNSLPSDKVVRDRVARNQSMWDVVSAAVRDWQNNWGRAAYLPREASGASPANLHDGTMASKRHGRDVQIEDVRTALSAGKPLDTSPPTTSSAWIAEELQKLAQLRSEGLLTESEFATAKAMVVSKPSRSRGWIAIGLLGGILLVGYVAMEFMKAEGTRHLRENDPELQQFRRLQRDMQRIMENEQRNR